MKKRLSTALLALLASGAAPADRDAHTAAAMFGARDGVLGVSISPDGKSLAIVEPVDTRGSVVLITKVDNSVPLRPILSSTGSPDRLTSCHWASDVRLACGIYMIDLVYDERMAVSRMMAINSDGTNAKQLSAPSTGNALGVALYGGGVIDWTGGAGNGSVLMTRVFIPEASTGTLVARQSGGLGVDRVDTRTLSRQTVEQPNANAAGYISDGRGHVRIMALAQNNAREESTGSVLYRYRKKDGREWLPLGTVVYSNYQAQGFEPVAVDPDLDVAYGLEKVDGRTRLYRIALDGSLRKELVYERPDSDVDEVVQIGRQHRVVGASWITDRRHVAFFDPELQRLAASLARALPGTPNISFVDASADEQQLVLFASSDTDPGRFYLFDKATKHLAEILPVRPQLAAVHLAEMRSIRYQAADGTSVPAYLTLPPGSTGRNLPAIVLPHGGPTYRDEWNFDWLPQYFANRGFAVIQPEFRGSAGYGDSWFLQNGIRSWRSAIGDINDAGRWLVQQGIADPNKLAIVGWSYGGYAALQSQVVDPTLFKAVVAIAPVTDWTAMRADAARGQTQAQVQEVFGDPSTAAAGSPARHADRFLAPVLMFQGDVDQNVPVAQSRLMEARLRSAHKRVERVEYRGLDHQLDDSGARTEMLARIDAFIRAATGD